MTIGDLVMYLSFTALMAMPMIQLASIGTQVSEAFAGLDRIREIREMATEDEEDATRAPLAGRPRRSGVRRRELRVQRRRAGAETRVVPLAGGFDDGAGGVERIRQEHADQPGDDLQPPAAGRVLVDGRDLWRSSCATTGRSSAWCCRTTSSSTGRSPRTSPTRKPHATREEIKAVSRIAHCDEFIEGFEQQYDTIVGERGVRLSGGQRQRVAIARAILANPRMLILDEATSSLDSESEALIQDGLKSLRQGRTTFVIAHRLSTIRSADQILVLEQGEIVERGTHDELLVRGGRYRQLYDKQYRFEKDRFINPGEDFTPEPEKVATPARASSAL